MLCGMLAGGIALDTRDYFAPLADVVNQGDPLSDEVSAAVEAMFEQIRAQLLESDFALDLCLPDDNAPISQRAQALVTWVEGFLFGFGLHQTDMTSMSADVREVLEDFSNIMRMEDDLEENEASESALNEVAEYVRVSAMLCFNELGKRMPAQAPDKPDLLH